MFQVKIIRTDEKAAEFGKIAFTGEFTQTSVVGAAGYLSQMARGCETVGAYRVDVTNDF